jgi:proteasome accessory factor A
VVAYAVGITPAATVSGATPARTKNSTAGMPSWSRASARADAVSRRILGLWERVLDAVGAGNLDAIAREIDWVIKYQLIERYRAERDLPLTAPQVAQADLAYHDIRRGHGLYYQLQRSGVVERTARDIDIFEAKTVPPAPGRYRQAG